MRKRRPDFIVLSLYSITVIYFSIVFSRESKIKITFDGVLYVSSAKALFTSNMGEQFQWIREPGYPLFLKLFLGEPDNFSNIISVQAALIAISSILCFAYFYFHANSLALKVLVFLAGIYSYFISYGYSTWILQQTFFIFLTSLHLMYLWLVKSSTLSKKNYVLISSLLLLLTAIWSVILLPASLAVVIYSFNKKQLKSGETFKNNSLVWISLILPMLLFVLSWNVYKFSEINKSQRLYDDVASVTDYGKADVRSLIYMMPFSLGGMLGFGPEPVVNVQPNLPSYNHFSYSFFEYGGGLGCTLVSGGPENIVKLLGNQLPSTIPPCTGGERIKIFGQIAEITGFSFPLMTFSTFVGLIFLLGQRRYEDFLIPFIFPFISVLPYLLEEYGISRYGLPFIFLSPFFFVFITFRLLSGARSSVRPK